MREHESRPKAAPEASRPVPIVRTHVVLRVSISGAEATRGVLTAAGARAVRRTLTESLGAPVGARIVLEVGRVQPVLIDPEMWAELTERFEVTIEASTAWVASAWWDLARAVVV